MGARALVVHDQMPTQRSVRRALEAAGYEVDAARGGRAALLGVGFEAPDVVVLWADAPGDEGWATLARIREESDVPVLVLAAGRPDGEAGAGLVAGVHDQLPPPIDHGELVARVTRLVHAGLLRGLEDGRYADRWLEVDVRAGTVRAGGVPVGVSSAGLRLLGVLVGRAGRAVDARRLCAAAWPRQRGTSVAQLRIQIARLRAALGAAPGGGSPVETLRGRGYRYAPPAVAEGVIEDTARRVEGPA